MPFKTSKFQTEVYFLFSLLWIIILNDFNVDNSQRFSSSIISLTTLPSNSLFIINKLEKVIQFSLLVSLIVLEMCPTYKTCALDFNKSPLLFRLFFFFRFSDYILTSVSYHHIILFQVFHWYGILTILLIIG